jgi:hypothetical protein
VDNLHKQIAAEILTLWVHCSQQRLNKVLNAGDIIGRELVFWIHLGVDGETKFKGIGQSLLISLTKIAFTLTQATDIELMIQISGPEPIMTTVSAVLF